MPIPAAHFGTPETAGDQPTRGPALSLEPGRKIAHYQIVEKLGAGGMGVVFRAVDLRLDRHVALKVLAEEVAAGREARQRFEREAKAVAALNHPNIVTLYSVEEAEGVRFLTMELVEGRTLAEILPPAGLPLERFLEYAVPLADALASAHERGIVHRDLKPRNVMVGTDGRLRILDFGLAKLRDPVPFPETANETAGTLTNGEMTGTGQVMGTVPYMSPEQLQGKNLDHRTDLFSLGIILYEMATGARPFKGGSPAELISSILRDSPTSVSESRTGFPRPVGDIVRRCLEKDPERRFQSARELRDELQALRRDGGGGRIARRIRLWTALCATAAGLIAAGVFLYPGRSEVDAAHSVVAVLPFTNLTGDLSKNYLSEGISAGLITELSEVSGIRVASRSAVRSVSEKYPDPGELASRLGVGSFLEGEVQMSGDHLRVDVKLTDADSRLVLWSDRFDGGIGDVFSLQNKIARQLATVLSVPLSRKELRRLVRDPTKSFRAYEYFLRGIMALDDWADPRSDQSAVEQFRQALRLDPEFALAHVGLSEALWRGYQRDKASEKLNEADREARRALELDPELPAAQVAVARVLRSTGHLAESIDELRKVLASHPKPDEAQREMAFSYQQIGDIVEAEKFYRAAVSVGSTGWDNWNALGNLLHELARYDEAREAFQRAAELAPPGISSPRENVAAMDFSQGRFDQAIEEYESLPKPIRRANAASNLGTSYYFSAHPDRLAKAEEYYRLAVRLDPASPVIRANLADLYVDLGRREDALENYREALRITEAQLQNAPGDFALQLDQALYAAKAQQCDKAVRVALALAPAMPQTANNGHDLAYAYALCNRPEEALEALATAVRLGFSPTIIRQESEFGMLKADPRFLKLIAEPSGKARPAAGG